MADEAVPALRPLKLFIIAGEASGDQLGAKLIAAMQAAGPISLSGVGGPLMVEAGLNSLFPMSDIAVMGLVPVLKRLPLLIRRIKVTALAVMATRPDVLVLIDAPDFTHRVAKKVRKACPDLPIIDYVSPTVWAWRPGRAKKMRAYTDHVMALLPFEPAAHRRLGGPDCTYVGHPLIERLAEFRPQADDPTREDKNPLVLILPGSRRSEIHHKLQVFGESAQRIAARYPGARFVLPAVPHLVEPIKADTAHWSIKPDIVLGEAAKLKAFRAARVALAASGTVSLELAIAQIPTVIAYKGSAIEAAIARRLVLVPSIVLPNLILGRNVVPEFLQEECTPEALSEAVLALIPDGAARQAQLDGFIELEARMQVEECSPSAAAARIVRALASPAN